ncbi:M23 family metallopeptidase [Shimazuella alba]|uniref:Peptidoglycan DD-metalloendopeptidase family protein n=1 Tax=Shimazuella alba TaxID=2690964 RepID=A0A6I4VXS8_9BACL|nr:M23 family metallopeptidase [Shimazuella alba]MXQ52862.1 peptidoglycan DD-metalloendopeptidase family protein [Shimazuella alba]
MKPEEPKNKVSFLDDNKNQKSNKSNQLLDKKWFFPAIYMTVAVCVLGMAWWYQSTKQQDVTRTSNPDVDTVLPVEEVPTDNLKQISLPITSDPTVAKVMDFYDANATDAAKESALVKYADTYWPHTGIDFARKNGKPFDVVASASGKVVRVEKNPVLGQVVEIKHENGLTTVYQSLSNVRVSLNQAVVKGDVIAEAGQNQFEKNEGIHLHFEVRKNNQALNPNDYVK